MPTEYNPSLIDSGSAVFRKLYNPAHAFADAVGMLQMFPGVVGIWPGNNVGSSSTSLTDLVDYSQADLHLARGAGGGVNIDGLAPRMSLNGADYFTHIDAAAFDITGNDAGIAVAIRGLTIGAWVRFDGGAGSQQSIMAKYAGSDRSYRIDKSAGDVFRMSVTNDGVTAVIVSHTTIATIDNWYFVCGRFDPSAELKIWTNGDVITNTTGVPGTIFSGSQDFFFGSRTAITDFWNGDISLAFLCKAAVPDQFINTFYQMTAPLFGVRP